MLSSAILIDTALKVHSKPKNEDNTRAMMTFKKRRKTVVQVITNDKIQMKSKSRVSAVIHYHLW
jgi:hypothetical protein